MSNASPVGHDDPSPIRRRAGSKKPPARQNGPGGWRRFVPHRRLIGTVTVQPESRLNNLKGGTRPRLDRSDVGRRAGPEAAQQALKRPLDGGQGKGGNPVREPGHPKQGDRPPLRRHKAGFPKLVLDCLRMV